MEVLYFIPYLEYAQTSGLWDSFIPLEERKILFISDSPESLICTEALPALDIGQ
jgi:hypothetical protein